MKEALSNLEWRLTRDLNLSRARNNMIGKSFDGLLKMMSMVMSVPKPSIYMGEGSSIKLCDIAANLGVKKILIVTDKMLYEMGLLNPILEKFEALGVEYSVFHDVLPDPTFSIVDQGLAQYLRERCDSVLAFGGGSSIDTAKVIAIAAANDAQPKDLVGILKAKEPAVPLFAIPTTAGTGSEATIGAVIADDETHTKVMVLDNKFIPIAAALDPGLMKGLPAPITAATGMDALTHAIESYLTTVANPESEHHSRSAIKLIFKNLPIVYKDGSDMAAREAMALASYYGGLALTSSGLGYVHAFAHPIGAEYKLPHGLANAKVLPYVLDFNKPHATQRLAELADLLKLGNGSESEMQRAQLFIDAVKSLIAEVGIDIGVPELQAEHYDEIIKAAFTETNTTYAVPHYMSYDEASALLHRIAMA